MAKLRCSQCGQVLSGLPLLDRIPTFSRVKPADVAQTLSCIYMHNWEVTVYWPAPMSRGQIYLYCPRCKGLIQHLSPKTSLLGGVQCHRCYKVAKLDPAIDVPSLGDVSLLENALILMNKICKAADPIGGYQFSFSNNNNISFTWICKSHI